MNYGLLSSWEVARIFDSMGIASGSHYVYGTIVIRTANYLTGTQQKELTQNILEELIEVK